MPILSLPFVNGLWIWVINSYKKKKTLVYLLYVLHTSWRLSPKPLILGCLSFPSVYLVYRLFRRQGERERMRAEKKRLKQEKEKKKKKWDKPSLSQLGEILLWLGGAVYLYTTVFWDKIEATATYSAYNNDTFPLFFYWRYTSCSFCKWGHCEYMLWLP